MMADENVSGVPGSRPQRTGGQVEVGSAAVRYTQAGHGGDVVLLDHWVDALPKLHDALALNYRITAVDLSGLGRPPAGADFHSPGELAASLAHALESIIAGRFTLIGTSVGANLALRLALHSPATVEALAMISPTAILPRQVPAPRSPQAALDLLLAHPSVVQGEAADITDAFAREQELARSLGGVSHDTGLEDRLAEVWCPALAVFGNRDKLVAPEAASVYRGKIINSNVAIVYDAGHLMLAERPEALIGAVGDFVDRRETFIVGHRSGLINP